MLLSLEDSTATFGMPRLVSRANDPNRQRRLVLIVAVAATIWTEASSQPAAFDIKALFDMYLRGQRDEAVAKAAAIPDLGPFRLRYRSGLAGVGERGAVARRSAQRRRRRVPARGHRGAARIGLGPLLGSDRVDVRATADDGTADASSSGPGTWRHTPWPVGRERASGCSASTARLPHQKPVAPPPAQGERAAAGDASDARDRAVPGRSAVPAVARGRVAVGARRRADPQRAAAR